MAAICCVLVWSNTAGTVEVDSDAIEGRTQAAITDFRNAMKLEPDLQQGAELFTTCAACHAASGLGTEDGSIPAIAGQHVSVLVKQLVDFRHDRRWGERMRNFASQHHLDGPQEMLDVAAYAGSLPRWPPLAGGTGDTVALNEGNVVYHRDCAACHGPLGLGELRRLRPRLAGQRYQYLLRQLEETADRMRPGMDVRHVKLIGALSAEERRAVADYLSRLSPNLASTQDQTPKPQ
ncbi:MAG TPA: c-type cytochrome [Steroidobacteraceae bacterium]|nr:c-type cytochrome [Steroidobacteraceae bacterium]